jgi:hypothetical protein
MEQMETPGYEFVEAAVRKKTFGVLSTIGSDGRPHSSGVLYGVAPPQSPFAIYMLTMPNYVKVRNVRKNPAANLVVPFPHRILSFIPANTVTFQGICTVEPVSDPDGRSAFGQHRILRDNLEWLDDRDPVFLKLTPEPKVRCFGLGISLRELRSNHTGGGYTVQIPTRVAS